jgi:hypothetical protein
MREICFYRTTSGECPLEEFLAGIGPKQTQIT